MAAIFCFTSTGNSLYTAKRIGEGIGARVLPVREEPAACEDDVIGFVFPVYFWGLPRIVARFVADLQIRDKNAYVFAVATYGGVALGVPGWLKPLLQGKGADLCYGVSLRAAENYIPNYKVKDTEEIRRKMEIRIDEITCAVQDRKTNRVSAPSLIHKAVNAAYPDENSDRFFTVSGACTGCAVCLKVCPAENIRFTGEKPTFLHKCEHCLACLHHCPASAIDWKNKTQGKARYRHKSVSLDDLISFYGR